VTAGQSNNNNGLDPNQSVTDKNDVTDEKQHNQLKLNNCHSVTDEKGGIEKDIEKTDIPSLKSHVKEKHRHVWYQVSIFPG